MKPTSSAIFKSHQVFRHRWKDVNEMAPKITFFITALIFLEVKSHDVFLGYPDTNSKLIYSKVHQENPAIWQRTDSFTVNCSTNEVINAIKILDLREDKWGEVYIKKGGIGERFVTIELDSPTVFRGYNFWVEVYAIETNSFLYNHGKKWFGGLFFLL